MAIGGAQVDDESIDVRVDMEEFIYKAVHLPGAGIYGPMLHTLGYNLYYKHFSWFYRSDIWDLSPYSFGLFLSPYRLRYVPKGFLFSTQKSLFYRATSLGNIIMI